MPQKIKLCLLTEYFTPYVMGGAEMLFEHISKELIKYGIEVHILTPNYGNLQTYTETKEGITIHRFASLRSFLYKQRKTTQKAYKKSRAFFTFLLMNYVNVSSRELAYQFNKLNKKEHFDIVHANNIESSLALPRIKGSIIKISHLQDLGIVCPGYRTKGKEYCRTCTAKNISRCLDSNHLTSLLLKHEIKKRRKMVRKINHFISINQYVKEEVTKEGIDKKKIKVVYTTIGSDSISELSKEEARQKLGLKADKTIIFIGRLSFDKGVNLLLPIAKRLPEYDFIVIGSGPMQDDFNATELKNVKYKGQLPITEARDYIKGADLFVNLPYMNTGYGRTIVEAQLNATAAIASDIKGIGEICNGDACFLTPKDLDSFVTNIKKIMQDNKFRNQIATNGFKRSSSLFKNNMTEEIIEIYKNLLNEKKIPQ